jgi:hypothetical protein
MHYFTKLFVTALDGAKKSFTRHYVKINDKKTIFPDANNKI